MLATVSTNEGTTMSQSSEAETETCDVAVVGGGIAGLVAGLTAAESGARVVLFDAHPIGGRARTTERNGYLYNTGPHALFVDGHLQPFLSARNLSPSGKIPGSKHGRLLRDGQLWPLMLGPLDIARSTLLSPRGRLRLLALFARIPRLHTEQFVGVPWQEFLGNEPDDVAGILRMFVRTATYVNAPAALDTAAALDQLKCALKGGVRYIDGGWQTIVDSLAMAFGASGGTVRTGRSVTTVSVADGPYGVAVETPAGLVRANAAVIAGISPEATSRITGAAVCGLDQVGSAVHAAVLDLALNRVHDGLVFGIDQPLYLSPHAPIARLAPAGTGLVSLLRYIPDGEQGDREDGDRGGLADADPNSVASTSADANRAGLARLAELAGISAADIVHERFLHRLIVANGFPVASGGGLRGRPSVDALGLDGVFIAGDWVGPHGQLADASSASAEVAARRAVTHSAKRAAARV